MLGNVFIGVANGPAEPARRPTKYPAGLENVSAAPVKTDRSPWQALIGATGYAPKCIASIYKYCVKVPISVVKI